MDYLSAAVAVLREAKRAMAVAEITQEAIRRGYLAPAGRRTSLPPNWNRDTVCAG